MNIERIWKKSAQPGRRSVTSTVQLRRLELWRAAIREATEVTTVPHLLEAYPVTASTVQM